MDFRDLRGALNAKGKTIEDPCKDHVFFYVEVEGKRERVTKISHGAHGQIDVDLLGKISRQMRLTTSELKDFVDCTLSHEKWVGLWKARNPYRK